MAPMQNRLLHFAHGFGIGVVGIYEVGATLPYIAMCTCVVPCNILCVMLSCVAGYFGRAILNVLASR